MPASADAQRQLEREAHELVRSLGAFHRRLLAFETHAHALGMESGRQGDERAHHALKELFAEIARCSMWLVEAHLALNQPFAERQRREADRLWEQLHGR